MMSRVISGNYRAGKMSEEFKQFGAKVSEVKEKVVDLLSSPCPSKVCAMKLHLQALLEKGVGSFAHVYLLSASVHGQSSAQINRAYRG